MANKEDDGYYYYHRVINHLLQTFVLAKDGLYVITGRNICQA
jgi:hypothetical protein